jgi:hypothetical protein
VNRRNGSAKVFAFEVNYAWTVVLSTFGILVHSESSP